jgi:ACR3 family arsenite efflux pump ArsB
MQRAVDWWDERKIPLYVAAIVLGVLLGLVGPQLAPRLADATNPVLALLLFATFLAVRLTELGRAFRDLRFLGTVLTMNFIVVPAIAFALSRFVADDRGLLLGVLLVLLTP